MHTPRTTPTYNPSVNSSDQASRLQQFIDMPVEKKIRLLPSQIESITQEIKKILTTDSCIKVKTNWFTELHKFHTQLSTTQHYQASLETLTNEITKLHKMGVFNDLALKGDGLDFLNSLAEDLSSPKSGQSQNHNPHFDGSQPRRHSASASFQGTNSSTTHPIVKKVISGEIALIHALQISNLSEKERTQLTGEIKVLVAAAGKTIRDNDSAQTKKREFVQLFKFRTQVENDRHIDARYKKILSDEIKSLSGAGAFSGLDLANMKEELRSLNLSDLILNGCNLTDSNLSNCDLRRTQFDGATLEGTNLTWTLLLDTNFNGANLSGADFSYNDLREPLFGLLPQEPAKSKPTNLHKANFYSTTVTQKLLDKAKKDGAINLGVTYVLEELPHQNYQPSYVQIPASANRVEPAFKFITYINDEGQEVEGWVVNNYERAMQITRQHVNFNS